MVWLSIQSLIPMPSDCDRALQLHVRGKRHSCPGASSQSNTQFRRRIILRMSFRSHSQLFHAMSSISAPFRVRPAVLLDLPRITSVCLAGLPDDPTFDYLWRYRRLYPEDNYFFWLQRFKAELYHPDKTLLVAVQDSKDADVVENRGSARETIVAFAIWERNPAKSRLDLSLKAGLWPLLHRVLTSVENWAISKEFTRRDGDPARMAAFFGTMDQVHAKYWERMYPQNYHLDLLATHPDYRRRGAGTLLVQWGLARATQEGVDVGVESSPMGFPLYTHMGFSLQETVTVRVDGEDMSLDVKVMVFDKSREKLLLK